MGEVFTPLDSESFWQLCEATGKRAWVSRREARKARKRAHGARSVYRCMDHPEHFHLGNLPPGKTREDARELHARKHQRRTA
jgi:hypothetical protein